MDFLKVSDHIGSERRLTAESLRAKSRTSGLEQIPNQYSNSALLK
jgi:hypothetical protein